MTKLKKNRFIYGLILIIFYSCNPIIDCPKGQCLGDSGKYCYECEPGAHCTKVKENSRCSEPEDGVYCCPDGGSGGSGCIPTGCPSSHPWLCCGKCYTSAEHDTNGDGINDCSMCRKCP